MATAPLVLLALSTLSVRALPGQDVGGPPKPAAADSVPAVDVPARFSRRDCASE
jgi:hypothetical protein